MTYEVEKEWITAAGFKATVVLSDGHRCGYVGVPEGHPLHGVSYNEHTPNVRPVGAAEPFGKRGILSLLTADMEHQRLDIIFDVHGSLTFSNTRKDGGALWWFGFDCAHSDDLPSPEWIAKQSAVMKGLYSHRDGEHRSLDYCVQECESLAQQIVERTITTGDLT